MQSWSLLVTKNIICYRTPEIGYYTLYGQLFFKQWQTMIFVIMLPLKTHYGCKIVGFLFDFTFVEN